MTDEARTVGHDHYLRWIERGLSSEDEIVVGSFLPAGFDRYIKLLHPGQVYENGVLRDITWHEIGEISGGEVTSSTKIGDLLGESSQADSVALPPGGVMPDATCQRLTRFLDGLTSDRGTCFFAFHGSWAAFLPPVGPLGRHHFLGQEMVLIAAEVTDACDFSVSGTLWWPEDRLWLVATPLDYYFSLVGCSVAVASALLDEPGLETFVVSWDQGASL